MIAQVEIAVFNITSALNAQMAGANRIELCDNPAEGGTTPSYGVMDAIRRRLNIDIMVMIRPRGGDFNYSDAEYEAMKSDVIVAKRMGMEGVVFGILDVEGRIDEKRCKELIQLARPMQATCHRAFDLTPNPAEALEACIQAGFSRILTSGGAAKAEQGTQRIAELVRQSAGRICILAGVGINGDNVKGIVEATGVSEVHLSARTWVESSTPRPETSFKLTEALPTDTGQYIADPQKVEAVLRALADN